MSQAKTLIHNAIIVNEGRRYRGYVVIDGCFIKKVGEGDPDSEAYNGYLTLDASGKMLLPGAIDTHVHFRDPGLTHKSSIRTESAAAVAGGVTSFLDMPNTIPAATTVDVIDIKKAIAARDSVANYGFFIGATNTNAGELLNVDFSRVPGIKLFLGSSTGNMLVDDSSAIDRLFRDFKGIIAVHAEDEATIAANRCRLTAELGDELPIGLHSILRSREACMKASRRAVATARKYGTRLHLLHISTADELDLLDKGPIRGKSITAETCPHYLLFTAADLFTSEGNLRKCNPAVKGCADRDALRQAITDGLIDTIATDHAPHLRSEKEGSLLKAASGMPGIKYMLPLMLDLADGVIDGLTYEKIAELTAHNPATLYGIDRRGYIRPGYYADMVIVGKTSLPQTIVHSDSVSHLADSNKPGYDWTPYAGMQIAHRVAATFVNGRQVYDGIRSADPDDTAMELRFDRRK